MYDSAKQENEWRLKKKIVCGSPGPLWLSLDVSRYERPNLCNNVYNDAIPLPTVSHLTHNEQSRKNHRFSTEKEEYEYFNGYRYLSTLREVAAPRPSTRVRRRIEPPNSVISDPACWVP